MLAIFIFKKIIFFNNLMFNLTYYIYKNTKSEKKLIEKIYI